MREDYANEVARRPIEAPFGLGTKFDFVENELICYFVQTKQSEIHMAQVLSVTDAREQLAEITGRVRFAGERIVLQKHGKTVAAVVSPSDLDALEALEDRLDLLDALDALADYRANGGESFEEIKADLGL